MTSLLIHTFSLILAFPTALPQRADAKAQSQGSLKLIIQRKNKRPAVSTGNRARRSPKAITAEIEKIVREELSDPERERLEKWDFTVYKNDKSLSVGEPGQDLSLDPSDPHILPFNAQFNLESMKAFLLGSEIPASQWQPRLAAYKDAIYQTVEVIESARNRNQLLKGLEQKVILLNLLLNGLKEFIVNFYSDEGYRISLSPGAGALIDPVPVATDPPGGTIRVIKYLNYKKCNLFLLSTSACPWLTLYQNTAPLLGRYRYMVSWPDGRKAEGDIRIVSTEKIIFR